MPPSPGGGSGQTSKTVLGLEYKALLKRINEGAIEIVGDTVITFYSRPLCIIRAQINGQNDNFMYTLEVAEF